MALKITMRITARFLNMNQGIPLEVRLALFTEMDMMPDRRAGHEEQPYDYDELV